MKEKYPVKFMFMLNKRLHSQLLALAKKEQKSMGGVVRWLIQLAYDQMVSNLNLDKES